MKEKGPHIPEGISIDIIEPSAVVHSDRYDLLRRMGARDCDARDVCGQIAKLHSGDNFDALRLRRSELIAQVRFMHRACWQGEGLKLWFATRKGGCKRGPQLYLRVDSGKSQLSGISKKMDTSFEFIHDDYLHVPATEKAAWISWLKKTCGISDIPRLVEPGTLLLSNDFRILLAACQSRDILFLLRENWSYYSQWLENDAGASPIAHGRKLPEQVAKMRPLEGLKSQQVRCCNRFFALEKTILPMLDPMLDNKAWSPTIELYDPLNTGWKILCHLGVAVERNAQYYIRCLEALRGSHADATTLTHIYTQLSVRDAQEGDFIR